MRTFTGHYGFGLILDKDTNKQAKILSFPYGEPPGFETERPYLPLYNLNVRQLPELAVQNMLKEFPDLYQMIFFANIAIFGEKFVLWKARETPFLRRAHEVSLRLHRWRNREQLSPLQSQWLQKLSASEKESLRQYGHPLAGSAYIPHITLAFHPRRIPLLHSKFRGHYAYIRRLVFMRYDQDANPCELL